MSLKVDCLSTLCCWEAAAVQTRINQGRDDDDDDVWPGHDGKLHLLVS